MSEAEKAIWTAIHHYESVWKTNKQSYSKETLNGLNQALKELKQYEKIKKFIIG